MKSVGTNGVGEPRYNVDEVPPGCIARFGIDDDSVVLVLASFPDTYYDGNGKRPCHVHVYLNMETGEVMRQSYGGYVNVPGKKETLTVLLAP
jgi:hypothetical protein